MIIWRGLGWLIPAILFAVLIATHLSVNAYMGDDHFYSATAWPKYLAVGIGSVLVIISALIIRKRDPENRGGHALFFIPYIFWALLAPVSSFAIVYAIENDAGQERVWLKSPKTGDKYVVNLEKIIKLKNKTYNWGVFKVTTVKPDAVEVRVGNMVYNGASGSSKDISAGKADAPGYYSKTRLRLKRDALLKLRRKGVIREVHRN